MEAVLRERPLGHARRRMGRARAPIPAGLRAGAEPARRARAACSTSAAAPARSCAPPPNAAREVSGLDASPALLELAREHVPEADLAMGDLQAPALRRRDVRRRHELHLVLVRRRPGRGAARGRAGGQAGRPGARGGPRPAGGERPARGDGRDGGADRPRAAAPDAARAGRARGALRAAGLVPPARRQPRASRSSSPTRRRSSVSCAHPRRWCAPPAPWARSAWRRRSARRSRPRRTAATGSRTSGGT